MQYVCGHSLREDSRYERAALRSVAHKSIDFVRGLDNIHQVLELLICFSEG